MSIPRHLQPKIIGVTGHIAPEFTDLGLKSGMDKVVAKPVYVDKMKETLRWLNLIWF